MKKIKLLSFASMLLFAGIHVNAQTVDEIVNRNTEAMGGKEKLASLKTVKMTGNISAQGTDISLTIIKSHLTGFRLDFEVQGTSNYQLANTKTGWVFMPAFGMPEPKEMDPAQFKLTSTQMDVQGSLFNYKEKGTTVELIDSQKVDGKYAYKLKLSFQNGEVTHYFINTKTNRLVKTSGKVMIQGEEMEIETVFSDYKQNTDGYWFPYTIASSQSGTMSIEKIETNIPVDEKIYTN